MEPTALRRLLKISQMDDSISKLKEMLQRQIKGEELDACHETSCAGRLTQVVMNRVEQLEQNVSQMWSGQDIAALNAKVDSVCGIVGNMRVFVDGENAATLTKIEGLTREQAVAHTKIEGVSTEITAMRAMVEKVCEDVSSQKKTRPDSTETLPPYPPEIQMVHRLAKLEADFDKVQTRREDSAEAQMTCRITKMEKRLIEVEEKGARGIFEIRNELRHSEACSRARGDTVQQNAPLASDLAALCARFEQLEHECRTSPVAGDRLAALEQKLTEAREEWERESSMLRCRVMGAIASNSSSRAGGISRENSSPRTLSREPSLVTYRGETGMAVAGRSTCADEDAQQLQHMIAVTTSHSEQLCKIEGEIRELAGRALGDGDRTPGMSTLKDLKVELEGRICKATEECKTFTHAVVAECVSLARHALEEQARLSGTPKEEYTAQLAKAVEATYKARARGGGRPLAAIAEGEDEASCAEGALMPHGEFDIGGGNSSALFKLVSEALTSTKDLSDRLDCEQAERRQEMSALAERIAACCAGGDAGSGGSGGTRTILEEVASEQARLSFRVGQLEADVVREQAAGAILKPRISSGAAEPRLSSGAAALAAAPAAAHAVAPPIRRVPDDMSKASSVATCSPPISCPQTPGGDTSNTKLFQLGERWKELRGSLLGQQKDGSTPRSGATPTGGTPRSEPFTPQVFPRIPAAQVSGSI
eukprot:gnl/TRDRNA2_/TRDRNA2_145575_c2_seq1.p1 gnl/TRDRNA2_/TRDRNA2_145575_c2~~gnl/TRDRNA2_/TRDRNA2_145575_c2_seq1.p1  ORF type:complete len:739 (+),score=159.44 gnl/TRDRNA2_/TRDRNA2_145575_c2_seq1:96-2219(+)